MNNENDKFLNFSITGAAVLLFQRTMDIMSLFAPQSLSIFFGFDVSQFYGAANAFFVEGIALALHFNQAYAKNKTAQWVKWSLLSISGACQVFDGFIITDTLSRQSDTMKAIFQWGVPLVPLVIVVMLFAVGQGADKSYQRKPFIGLKNIPASFAWIWDGENTVGKKSGALVTHQQDVDLVVNPTTAPPQTK